MVIDDCHQVMGSAKLKRLIAVVLAVGNYLNEGSNRCADAIALESILVLKNVRYGGYLAAQHRLTLWTVSIVLRHLIMMA